MEPQFGSVRLPAAAGIGDYDFLVSVGSGWMSLNDHLNYQVADKTMESTSVSRKRFTVESAMYDGTWEVHSVLQGVQENVGVYVLGQDQNMVTENYLALTEAFSQAQYNIKIVMGNHVETWRCFPAEWKLDRGRVNAHNVRAEVQFSVPRFPKVTYEVQG